MQRCKRSGVFVVVGAVTVAPTIHYEIVPQVCFYPIYSVVSRRHKRKKKDGTSDGDYGLESTVGRSVTFRSYFATQSNA